MEANELRIGNYVNGKHRSFFRVDEFCKDSQGEWELRMHVRKGGYYSCNIKNVEPIPLTEEILTKCGFEISRKTKEDNNVWRKCWDDGHFELEQIMAFYFGVPLYCTDVMYLHQLQNLYFALTGTELDVKL